MRWDCWAKYNYYRIIEEEIESAIESRNEALQTLRELGPPDLVHLVKQSVKSGGRQVCLECRNYEHKNPFSYVSYRSASTIMLPV